MMRCVLNFNHLHYFHAVAAEGSIVRAAEKLGLSQPTVSEQVRQLERALQTSLFDRTPSGLKLTDAGRQALAQTSVMFGAAERMVQELSGVAARPRTLRVGISNSASRSVAADFLTPLLKMEECIPSVRSGDSLELLRQVRDSELDLVLSEETPPSMEGLAVVEIYRPHLIAVTTPDRAEKAPNKVWDELPMIHYLPGSRWRWMIDSFFKTGGRTPRVIAESDDAQFMVEAAIRGMCVAFVPYSVARDAIQQNKLRAIAALPTSDVALNAFSSDGKGVAHTQRAIELLLAYAQENTESYPVTLRTDLVKTKH